MSSAEDESDASPMAPASGGGDTGENSGDESSSTSSGDENSTSSNGSPRSRSASRGGGEDDGVCGGSNVQSSSVGSVRISEDNSNSSCSNDIGSNSNNSAHADRSVYNVSLRNTVPIEPNDDQCVLDFEEDGPEEPIENVNFISVANNTSVVDEYEDDGEEADAAVVSDSSDDLSDDSRRSVPGSGTSHDLPPGTYQNRHSKGENRLDLTAASCVSGVETNDANKGQTFNRYYEHDGLEHMNDDAKPCENDAEDCGNDNRSGSAGSDADKGNEKRSGNTLQQPHVSDGTLVVDDSAAGNTAGDNGSQSFTLKTSVTRRRRKKEAQRRATSSDLEDGEVTDSEEEDEDEENGSDDVDDDNEESGRHHRRRRVDTNGVEEEEVGGVRDSSPSAGGGRRRRGSRGGRRNKRASPTAKENICRFFSRGQCTWGSQCRFVHPGFDVLPPPPSSLGPAPYAHCIGPLPTGARGSIFPGGPPGPFAAGGPAAAPIGGLITPGGLMGPPMPLAPVESAWERGLRSAKQMLKEANRRREEDPTFEDRKLHQGVQASPVDAAAPAGSALDGDDDDVVGAGASPSGVAETAVFASPDRVSPSPSPPPLPRSRFYGTYDDDGRPYGRRGNRHQRRFSSPSFDDPVAFPAVGGGPGGGVSRRRRGLSPGARRRRRSLSGGASSCSPSSLAASGMDVLDRWKQERYTAVERDYYYQQQHRGALAAGGGYRGSSGAGNPGYHQHHLQGYHHSYGGPADAAWRDPWMRSRSPAGSRGAGGGHRHHRGRRRRHHRRTAGYYNHKGGRSSSGSRSRYSQSSRSRSSSTFSSSYSSSSSSARATSGARNFRRGSRSYSRSRSRDRRLTSPGSRLSPPQYGSARYPYGNSGGGAVTAAGGRAGARGLRHQQGGSRGGGNRQRYSSERPFMVSPSPSRYAPGGGYNRRFAGGGVGRRSSSTTSSSSSSSRSGSSRSRLRSRSPHQRPHSRHRQNAGGGTRRTHHRHRRYSRSRTPEGIPRRPPPIAGVPPLAAQGGPAPRQQLSPISGIGLPAPAVPIASGCDGPPPLPLSPPPPLPPLPPHARVGNPTLASNIPSPISPSMTAGAAQIKMNLLDKSKKLALKRRAPFSASPSRSPSPNGHSKILRASPTPPLSHKGSCPIAIDKDLAVVKKSKDLFVGSSKKSDAAKREELMKQLKAVEDAIAKKKAKS